MPAGRISKHETRKLVRPQKLQPHAAETIQDELGVEEPMEIRVQDQPVAQFLRTPSDDYDLAAGFLFTRGVIRSEKDLKNIWHKAESPNVVHVAFEEGFKFDAAKLRPNPFGPGVSAKAALESLKGARVDSSARMRIDVLYELVHTMRRARTHFHRSGGLHAAAVFDLKGTLHMLREDVERLNAIDKSVGAMLLQGRAPLDNYALLVTGRAGYEVLQKAVTSRIAVVCSNNAPSSLAVEVARETGITLICFLPGEELNVYTHAERIEV